MNQYSNDIIGYSMNQGKPQLLTTQSQTTQSKKKGTIVQLNSTNERPDKYDITTSYFTNGLQNKHYSPFSLEFKRTVVSMISDYGQQFNISIPIFGDLLYRSFFEIELPVLNFTDSIITDTNYIQYKNNKLSNINNDINYWATQNSNFELYSNIQISGYVQAKNILVLNNITLTFLQSRTLTIINTQHDNLYKYKLFIDTNIVTSVDILNYIMSLKTLDVKAVQTQLDIMYNNILNYLKYYNSNLVYSNRQYQIVNTGKILCRWIDYIGHFYFNYFELNVNGFTLDNYSNDYLHIKQLHNTDSNYVDNYNKLIGNTEDIYVNKGSPNYIYTPLIFSYNNIEDSSNALPLVGMVNTSIKINSMINTIKNLVYLQDWEDTYNKMLIVSIKRKDHVINNTTNTITIYDLPYNSYTVMIPEYIYIYNCDVIDSRVLEAVYPGIDSTTILQNYGSYNSKWNTTVLSLDDMIVMMNAITTKTDKFLSEQTKTTLAGYHYFIDYNLVLNKIPKPKVSLLVEYGYLDNYDKKMMATTELKYIVETRHEIILQYNNNSLYESLNDINGLVKDIYMFARQLLYKNGISLYGKNNFIYFQPMPNPIDTIALNISNEYNLFDYYNTGIDTFNNVQAYYYLIAPVPSGVLFKTFSLDPNKIQPSGCINMNIISGQNVAINVNDNNDIYYNSKINPNKMGTEFKIIYTKYNILIVKNGQADLQFYS